MDIHPLTPKTYLSANTYHTLSNITPPNLTLTPLQPACIQAAEAYSHIAQGLGVTAAQLALAYVLHQPFVSSAVLGVTTVAQLHENIEATGIVLQPSTLAALDKVHRVSRNPQFED